MLKNCWCFCSGLDEWREFVNTSDECRKTLYGILCGVLVPATKKGKDLRQALSEYLNDASQKADFKCDRDGWRTITYSSCLYDLTGQAPPPKKKTIKWI